MNLVYQKVNTNAKFLLWVIIVPQVIFLVKRYLSDQSDQDTDDNVLTALLVLITLILYLLWQLLTIRMPNIGLFLSPLLLLIHCAELTAYRLSEVKDDSELWRVPTFVMLQFGFAIFMSPTPLLVLCVQIPIAVICAVFLIPRIQNSMWSEEQIKTFDTS